MPTVSHVRLTVTNPTRFPTGDGRFPMGAYLAFQRQVLFEDHMAIDHNQKIWLSARATQFDTCEGAVPFLITPMSNFIEFAIRMRNQEPRPLDAMKQSRCGFAYVDARSMVRGYHPNSQDGALFSKRMNLISPLNDGEPLVRIDARQPAGNETAMLAALRRMLGMRAVEIFLPARNIKVVPGLRYVVFSDQPCSIPPELGAFLPGMPSVIRAAWTASRLDSRLAAHVDCPSSWSGWARTSLPPYMGM
jgi:hypothetical protein